MILGYYLVVSGWHTVCHELQTKRLSFTVLREKINQRRSDEIRLSTREFLLETSQSTFLDLVSPGCSNF